MGMTIDEAISHLDTYSSTMGSGQTTQEQHEDAKRVAIATMRKYQKLEQEPTTNKDLGVDCISRTKALDCVNWGYNLSDVYKKINDLPSVTPQEPQTFKWCTDCKEYDQEKHCCHRWSKVIRDTVEEMKQESKIGHWINKQYLFESCSAECSSCHKRSNGIVHDNGFSLECKYFNFCPNCGAKMVEQTGKRGING